MKSEIKKYCRVLPCLILIAVTSIASACHYHSAPTDNESITKQTSACVETVSGTENDFGEVQRADSQPTKETIVDDGAEILHRFQSVDWETLLPCDFSDKDWSTKIVCLAELAKPKITMYGYNDEQYHGRGVAIEMEGSRYYFDWQYVSPTLVRPRLYWDEHKSQLQAAFHLYTGTELTGDEVHVLERTAEKMTDYCLDMAAYRSMLSERISYSYDAQTEALTFYDSRDDRKLSTVDMSFLKEKELTEAFKEIELGNITRIELGETMRLMVTPGYVTENAVFPRYEHMPELCVEIYLEEIDGQKQFVMGSVQRCLSDDELCDLAEKYYKAHNTGDFVPPIIEVDRHMEDGQVLIHLYEILDDHTASYDWYTVSRATGKGTNFLYEEIDLLEE